MRITRKDALTLLNSCFSKEIFERTCALGSIGFEKTFLIARMQLITAIILNHNNFIWQQFVINPVEFVEKYMHSDALTKSTNSVLSDFLMNASIKESSHSYPEQNDTQNELEGNRSTPKIILSVESFYDFWNTCCDIANIHIEMRNDTRYNAAKLDAFIYYSALSHLFGNKFSEWKKELLNSQVQIYTWSELEKSIDSAGTSYTIEDFIDSGIESNIFKCTLFAKEMSSYFSIMGTSSTDDSSKFFEMYTSMLFYPTSKKVKDLTTTILIEQTNAINIINSEKNFWGNDWPNEDTENLIISDEEISRISNKIIENTKSGITNLLRNKESFNKLPQIPAFEDAVKGGYFAEQDQEGHYRTIKTLSACLNNNGKLRLLTPKTLKQYIRKSDGSKYSNNAIDHIIS